MAISRVRTGLVGSCRSAARCSKSSGTLLSCDRRVNELRLALMIRIRPGRSWRFNPGYVRDLRQGANGSAVLDVLGIEGDGVNIAAGLGESHVLLAVGELA